MILGGHFQAWAGLILLSSAVLEIAKQQSQAQTVLQYLGEKKRFQSFPNSANKNKPAKENKDFTAESSSRGTEKRKSRGKRGIVMLFLQQYLETPSHVNLLFGTFQFYKCDRTFLPIKGPRVGMNTLQPGLLYIKHLE